MWEVSVKQLQMIGQLSTARNKELGLELSWLPGRTVSDVLAVSS